MRILFDHNVPDALVDFLRAHQITLCRQRGWSEIGNGDLIRVAEEAGFEMIVTTDQNIKYQQNLANRHISVVVLMSNHWLSIKGCTSEIASRIEGAGPGSYTEIKISFDKGKRRHDY